MPILHGYREIIPLNIYDAFSPRSLAPAHGVRPGLRPLPEQLRLFGNANIGNPALTNIQIGAYFFRDQTSFIRNWYGRSNISAMRDPEFLRAWDAWTHVTTMSLVVGSMPVHQLPLSDLLRRTEGQLTGQRPENYDGVSFAMHLHQSSDYAFAAPLTVEERPENYDGVSFAMHLHQSSDYAFAAPLTVEEAWTSLSVEAQGRWIRISHEASRLLYQPMLAVIPVRQNCSVSIATDPRALGCLLEVMPTDIAPQALVWVHLEGTASRDLA